MTFSKLLVASIIAGTVFSFMAAGIFLFLYSFFATLWFLKSGEWVFLTILDIDFLFSLFDYLYTNTYANSWFGISAIILWLVEMPLIISFPIILWPLIVISLYLFMVFSFIYGSIAENLKR